MRLKKYFLSIFSYILAIFILSFASPIFAKEINLYSEPSPAPKKIGSIDLSLGIIPIFTTKEGNWMKIANPRDGAVGWIKSSDLGNMQVGPVTFTFTEHKEDGGKNTHSYQMVQFGQSPHSNNKQLEAILKNLQVQQQNIQETLQKTIKEMINNVQSLYQHSTEEIGSTPLILPIVIVPQEAKPAAKQK